MRYAKMIDGAIMFAPNKIEVEISGEDYVVYNPTAEQLEERGFEPVEYTDPGEVVEGYHYEAHWEEQADKIVQVWELVSNDEMEIPDAEALRIILGEE